MLWVILSKQLGGYSSAGRAPDLHSGGHRFDPVYLHHYCEWGV